MTIVETINSRRKQTARRKGNSAINVLSTITLQKIVNPPSLCMKLVMNSVVSWIMKVITMMMTLRILFSFTR